MIDNLPVFISLIFGGTTVTTLLLFMWTMKHSNSAKIKKNAVFISVGSVIWLVFQAVLSLNTVYSTDVDSFPPKIMFIGIFPAFLVIIFLFATSGGRRFMDNLPLKNLTYLNIVRIPVETVLFWFFLNESIPAIMTFEGRNFDILAGITAPFIAYFGFTLKKISRITILIWNFISLGLLINIIVLALFSAPSPIQRMAFEQPNVAILHFPFSWLPTFIVPIILLGHLISIRQLLQRKEP